MNRSFIEVSSLLMTAAILLSACASPDAGAKKYSVATDATFPPFEMVNENTEELEGFDIDLMKAIAQKGGFEIEFMNIGFDPMLAGLSQCQYDTAIAAITITAERKKSMLFSEPYINAGQIVSVRKDNMTIISKNDLAGKKVGAQSGTTGSVEIKKIKGAKLKAYDSYDLAFFDLADGQIDAVVADYPTALGFVGANADKLKVVGDVFTDESYGVGVCKNNTALLDLINEGLKAAIDDGTVDQLEIKWLAGSSE